MTLLSTEFIALASLAAIGLPLLRGALRSAFLLGLSVWFAASYLTPVGMASTAVFLLVGYGGARWAQSGARWSVQVTVVGLTLVFAYLRGYDLIGVVLPDGWMFDALATAGLSFLLFKMLHVVVDAAAGTLGEFRFATYLLYCLNFTTFLLGPIQRYQDFEAQWSGREPSMPGEAEAHLDAGLRVLRGLVKKFVVAELLAPHVIFAGMDLEAYSGSQLLVRTYLFYLYLYFDFSGYCDVVIGIGMLMGVRPPENFHLPFLSRNVSEYWLRVHRSLTTWLTDYVFNPVLTALMRTSALRRRSFVAMASALMVTMLVSGLWHGTTVSFLLFGLVHGVFLVVWRGYERFMIGRMGRKGFRRLSARLPVRVAAVVLTYNVTSLAYLFFVFDVSEIVELARRFL